MAADAATVIEGAGLIREGFSFQTGAGGASLASAQFVREMMERAGVTGSFILGGITAQAVDMVNKGIFRKLLDVQGFDLEAVKSIAVNPDRVEISSSLRQSVQQRLRRQSAGLRRPGGHRDRRRFQRQRRHGL